MIRTVRHMNKSYILRHPVEIFKGLYNYWRMKLRMFIKSKFKPWKKI